jgi:hypothetical protein
MNKDSMPIQGQNTSEELQTAKKPYEKPEVTVLGTLVELTQANGGPGDVDIFDNFS